MNRNSPTAWTRAGPGAVAALAALTASAVSADEGRRADEGRMELSSTTFTNHGTLPPSAVYNAIVNGKNICTANGVAGGDMSPQLEWTHVPRDTRSFVVMVYDTTASFTHYAQVDVAHRDEAVKRLGEPTRLEYKIVGDVLRRCRHRVLPPTVFSGAARPGHVPAQSIGTGNTGSRAFRRCRPAQRPLVAELGVTSPPCPS